MKTERMSCPFLFRAGHPAFVAVKLPAELGQKSGTKREFAMVFFADSATIAARGLRFAPVGGRQRRAAERGKGRALTGAALFLVECI